MNTKLLKIAFLFLCVILLNSPAFGQDEEVVLTGTVRSMTEELMYATLGVVSENVGTVTDPHGYFKLAIPPHLMNQELTVSHVGYETMHLSLDSLRQLGTLDIVMVEKVDLLDEVEVSASALKAKDRAYGITRKLDSYVWVQDGEAGSEIVTLIEPKEEMFLKSVAVNILNMEKKEFTLLLNLYARDKATRLPSEQLLKKQMIITSDKKEGWLEVDLQDQKLVLSEPFFVGFQWVQMDDPTSLIGAKASNSEESLLRTQAFGKWQQQYTWNIKAIGTTYK